MSNLNDEQRDYLDSLSKLPASEKCPCGWYVRRECRPTTCAQPALREAHLATPGALPLGHDARRSA